MSNKAHADWHPEQACSGEELVHFLMGSTTLVYHSLGALPRIQNNLINTRFHTSVQTSSTPRPLSQTELLSLALSFQDLSKVFLPLSDDTSRLGQLELADLVPDLTVSLVDAFSHGFVSHVTIIHPSIIFC